MSEFNIGDLVVLADEDPKGVNIGFTKGAVLKIIGLLDETHCPHCGKSRLPGSIGSKYSVLNIRNKCAAVPADKLVRI